MRQSQATRSFEIPVEESEPEIFARLKGDLVIAFIHHVQSRFTDDMLARIDALNAGPGPVCHIHDFCNAIAIIEKAFVEVVGRETEADSRLDADLINAAWSEARRRGFSVIRDAS